MSNMRIAAGNLFIGKFDTKPALTNTMAATRFGLPFDKKPLRLTGYYKYAPGETYQDKAGKPVEGKTDHGDIYAVLYRNHDDNGEAFVLNGNDVKTNPYIGAENASNGGRDQGIQVQGDLFPVKDGHRLMHYQVMVSNGQGINTGDANSQKDVSGTLQLQPVKGVMIGFFGWTGNFTANGVTVNRNRYEIVGKYERNDWSFRAEYAHSTGHKISDYKDGNWTGNARYRKLPQRP